MPGSSAQLRVLSGMRPTGDLHLGHLLGVLKNWVRYQDSYECFFMIADWHALMSEYKNAEVIQEAVLSNLADWLAVGIDPKRSTIFVQSDVPQHTELHTILSTITPIPWLERCPTYKEQLQALQEKDIFTYAFLGYPVLQTADIALYQAHKVPVGKDQLPHLELGREIIRRFHHLFRCEIFPEPEPILDEVANKILGLDKRKMSKSYQNHITIGESKDSLEKKIKQMVTDEKRMRLTDPGHPDECNVYHYYQIFKTDRCASVRDWCENAQKGCSQCKGELAEIINDYLEPIRKKREEFLKDKVYLRNVLKEGAQKAEAVAGHTMGLVKQALGIKGALR